MEGFEFDNVKLKKADAMLRYRRLRNITKLFRILELCVALVFLSWIFTRLPFALRISGHYFRLLIHIILSPLFIFLFSNLIVLILLLKFNQSDIDRSSETHLYEDFLNNYSKNHINIGPDCFRPSLPAEPEEVVSQDKQIICEAISVITPNSGRNPVPKAENVEVVNSVGKERECGYRRSKSNNLKVQSSEGNCGKLQRSETEICRKVERSRWRSRSRSRLASGVAPAAEKVDKLSSEEFQRIIEAFIAKQVKFHQDEKLSIVLHTHA